MSITITVPVSILKDVTKKKIISVVKLSIGDFNDKQCKFIKRTGKGRYVEVTKNNKITYIVFSGNKNSGRNSLIIQYIKPVYNKFLLDKNPNKEFQVYFIIENIYKTPYHNFSIRLLKTLNIKILNNKFKKILPFKNYFEFKEARNKLKLFNPSNLSTYFTEENNKIYFYGKTFGANGMEATLFALVLLKLIIGSSFEKIYFYPVEDNDSTDIDLGTKEIMNYYDNIEILEPIKPLEKQIVILENNDDPRRSIEFHKNLLKKYGEKRCYLCECDIGELIIGAHIHRIADIKRSSIPKEEKIAQAVSSDNGLWLCSMHDKLFEDGLIYFDKNDLYLNDLLLESQLEFIKERTDKFKIDEVHYNKDMQKYIKKHKQRVLV